MRVSPREYPSAKIVSGMTVFSLCVAKADGRLSAKSGSPDLWAVVAVAPQCAMSGWRLLNAAIPVEHSLLCCRRRLRSSQHAGVVSVTSEKLLVRAVLNDGARSHDIDLITTSDGFESVRD
jgi:hypothetical protein